MNNMSMIIVVQKVAPVWCYLAMCLVAINTFFENTEMDSLLKLIFSNPNGIFTCYSMYLNRQSIKVMDDNLHS